MRGEKGCSEMNVVKGELIVGASYTVERMSIS